MSSSETPLRPQVRHPVSVVHRSWRLREVADGYARVDWQASVRNNTDTRMVVFLECRFVDDRFGNLAAAEAEVMVEPYCTGCCLETSLISIEAAERIADVWVSADAT